MCGERWWGLIIDNNGCKSKKMVWYLSKFVDCFLLNKYVHVGIFMFASFLGKQRAAYDTLEVNYKLRGIQCNVKRYKRGKLFWSRG